LKKNQKNFPLGGKFLFQPGISIKRARVGEELKTFSAINGDRFGTDITG